jgi:hypothetical protein
LFVLIPLLMIKNIVFSRYYKHRFFSIYCYFGKILKISIYFLLYKYIEYIYLNFLISVLAVGRCKFQSQRFFWHILCLKSRLKYFRQPFADYLTTTLTVAIQLHVARNNFILPRRYRKRWCNLTCLLAIQVVLINVDVICILIDKSKNEWAKEKLPLSFYKLNIIGKFWWKFTENIVHAN